MRDELESFLASLERELPDDFDEDTPLISSGCLDSVALFNLVHWIESKIGASVDPSAVDIGRGWDSMRLIVEFIEKRQDRTDNDQGPTKPQARRATGLRVVRYSAGLEDAIVDLQTGLWSPSRELNGRYFDWKYRRNPYAREPDLYLAFDGPELVGMRGFYPSRWQVGQPGGFEDVLVADDLVVREDRRNEGVVTQIMETALDDLRRRGAEYVFNLSGGHLTVLGSLAMGWRSAGHLKSVGRSSRSHAVIAALRQRLAALPLVWKYRSSSVLSTPQERNPFARLDGASRFASRRSGVVVDISAELRAKDMAALVTSLPYDGRLRHVRDETYLAWRYGNPLNEYRFFYAGSGALRGYLVAKRTRPVFGPTPRVQIVDWEAADERCLEALLEAAISAGAFPEIVTWAATRSPTVTDLLARNGFEPIDPGLAVRGYPCVLVRACDPSTPPDDWLLGGMSLLNLGNWDMRMIYSMAG